jgi:transcriptional regulatory protein RtcR
MATLAPQGRITVEAVDEEVRRLKMLWRSSDDGASAILHDVLGEEATFSLDRFDAIQLADVLQICRQHTTASAAGRALFAQSRLEKKSSNDADRLVKYLGRFGLKFEEIRLPPVR